MQNIKKLINLLNQQIENYKEKIIKDCLIFQNSTSDYKNIQYSESFCIILKKDSSEKNKSIGFPFPLISFPLEIQDNRINSISIHIFLRGKPLRNFQRNQLIEEISRNNIVEIYNIDTTKEFREIIKNLCLNYKKFNYFDPYSFIGDSFIGSFIPSNFSKYFDLEIKIQLHVWD